MVIGITIKPEFLDKCVRLGSLLVVSPKNPFPTYKL